MKSTAIRQLAAAVIALGAALAPGGLAVAAEAPAGDPGSAGAPAAASAPAAPAAPAAASAPAAPAALAAPTRRELNVVPIAGGDSDVGLGFGEVSDWASLLPGPPSTAPGALPYRWRLGSEAFITFKTQNGEVIVPFQDYSLLLTVPNFTKRKRMRLDIRGAFTKEATLKYYGFGNASVLPPSSLDIRDTEYSRIHPTLSIQARFNLDHGFFLVLGDEYTYNRLTVRPGTLLAADQMGGSDYVRSQLGAFGSHGVDLLEVGVQYDSRDNDIVTHRGMFHELKVRVSPQIEGVLPYAYQQVDATFRFYATPIPRWLTVTWRLVGDVLFGAPPFYELARFDETPAIGGGKAVRGVPAQRYYGKVKLFENFEARSELWPFHVKKKLLVLGLAAFFDAGRVWTEISHAHPELDGGGFGIKYGIGTGLRLQEGQTFVVRADIAWSPDASPIGAYFAAGEIF